MKVHAWVRLCAVAALLAGAGASSGAVVISDNFDDGNDAGWTRVDPNNDQFNEGQPNSLYGSFDASSGAYRIQALAGPVPQSPTRAAAYRGDQTYGDFRVSADLVAFDTTVDQGVGVVARLSQIGFGTTDGYLLNYNPSPGRPAGGALQIRRITNEGTALLGGVDVAPPLSGAGDYRLVFDGVGNSFTGRLFDSTGGLIASTTAVDLTPHAGPGFTGLLVANTSNGLADATFDNFSAVPEPGSVVFLGVAATSLLLRRRRGN